MDTFRFQASSKMQGDKVRDSILPWLDVFGPPFGQGLADIAHGPLNLLPKLLHPLALVLEHVPLESHGFRRLWVNCPAVEYLYLADPFFPACHPTKLFQENLRYIVVSLWRGPSGFALHASDCHKVPRPSGHAKTGGGGQP